MKGKYFVAAGVAIVSFALYYFLKQKKTQPQLPPEKENERHHLTNAFARAKRVAVGRGS